MTKPILPTGWPRGLSFPAGWDAPLLSEVAHRESGHTPDKEVPAYWNGGIKWLSLTDCDRLNRIYVGNTSKTISQAGVDNSSARLLPAGVVVLTRDAGVGQSAITTCPMAVSQHFLAWRCSDRLDPHFLYYWFQHLRPELERIAVGSTIKTIGLWYFDKFRIPLPPIELQRKAATALLECDRLGLSIEALVKSKKELKRGLMQQLLTGQKRFPEFRDIPWTHRPLGDFFKEKTVINRAKTVGLVYSCTKSSGIVPQAERFGKRLASADLGRYKVAEPGDLVYDPMLLWDGSIGFVPSTGMGVVSPAYETFSVRPEANQAYFQPLLKSYNLVERYKQISQGTNVRRRKAHPKDFLKILVPMPPTKAEQDRIAEVLTTIQREIDLLAALREQIDLERRGLLSRLLSGEIPVPA